MLKSRERRGEKERMTLWLVLDSSYYEATIRGLFSPLFDFVDFVDLCFVAQNGNKIEEETRVRPQVLSDFTQCSPEAPGNGKVGASTST